MLLQSTILTTILLMRNIKGRIFEKKKDILSSFKRDQFEGQ